MLIDDHPSFNRPPLTTKLWRYTDLPKFFDLLASRSLWLTNAELLAKDDPYEGMPSAIQFPHRAWKALDEVPENLQKHILRDCQDTSDKGRERAFRGWLMGEEQMCIMRRAGRRNFFVNCWHASDFESMAMWRVYAAPGAGVAIVTNRARIGSALSEITEDLYLGSVSYVANRYVQFGGGNAFDPFMQKRENFAYENEVRLFLWKPGEYHDPIANFNWNEKTCRFDDLIEDDRPILPGLSISCDLDTLIERVIVSPYAPGWYLSLVERFRERCGFQFEVARSLALQEPAILP